MYHHKIIWALAWMGTNVCVLFSLARATISGIANEY
jgi:hypothetical protein